MESPLEFVNRIACSVHQSPCGRYQIVALPGTPVTVIPTGVPGGWSFTCTETTHDTPDLVNNAVAEYKEFAKSSLPAAFQPDA